MSARLIMSALGRNVASSSRQASRLSLSQQVAAPRSASAQLRSQSLLHAPRSINSTSSHAAPRLQQRWFRTAPTLHNDRSRIEAFIPETSPSADSHASKTPSSDESAAPIPVTGERTPIGHIEQRLAITFTCTVDACGHRSSHEFSKRSYTKGIVIVQCPGCKNRHLIADNLSWFTENEGEPRTIEQMIEAKGGKVRRGTVDGETGETIEILS
ncbi:hypothetical protein PHSY_001539 [Pseudozyma hubeiensis SY62]|uniref:DNL-type domain-containing protein n=1 Tax=Pseudozyma hubeiensis (strain SY62) TaxID=1305764 RepID=R9P7A3_PSEHS|nr:hypothetical protein PHSY_001539 [Pseudozyma hubeiensis SY62]GAC93970.1 hypothetical protein PHSY_001539 [Pseudozyma hubeiensis SY62]